MQSPSQSVSVCVESRSVNIEYYWGVFSIQCQGKDPRQGSTLKYNVKAKIQDKKTFILDIYFAHTYWTFTYQCHPSSFTHTSIWESSTLPLDCQNILIISSKGCVKNCDSTGFQIHKVHWSYWSIKVAESEVWRCWSLGGVRG